MNKGNAEAAMKGYLETEIEFHGHFLPLSGDCAGAKIPFSLGGQDLNVSLPRFCKRRRGEPVAIREGTEITLNWFAENHWKILGYGMKGGKLDYFTCQSFIIRSENLLDKKKASLIKSELTIWRPRFIHWLEVITLKSLVLEGNEINKNYKAIPETYLVNGNKPTQIKAAQKEHEISVISIKIVAHKGISKAELKSALQHSIGSSDPPLAYSIFVQAKRHAATSNNREAILNGATAFELVLAYLLSQNLTSLPSRYRELIRKNLTIISLYEHLKALGLSMPDQSDVQTKICEPRNQAIHKGYKPSDQEVREALKFTEQCIKMHMPI